MEAWGMAPSLTEVRQDHGTVVYLNRIYAIGGWGVSRLSSVEVFDGTSWSSAPPNSAARSSFACAVYRNAIYLMGGWAQRQTVL